MVVNGNFPIRALSRVAALKNVVLPVFVFPIIPILTGMVYKPIIQKTTWFKNMLL